MTRPAKATRILRSQGLNQAKYDRLARIAGLCGRVRSDAWMAEGYGWHGLPARIGKATLADVLCDTRACREAAKVSVKKAVGHRTRGDGAERHRLYSLMKQNRWDEAPFLHLQGLERGQRHGEGLGDLLTAESDDRKIKGQRHNRMRDLEQKYRDAGNVQKADNIRRHNLGNKKWDRRQGQHNARVRDHLCQAVHSVVDRAGTITCEDLTAPMTSAKKVMHRDTQRRLNGWVKGVMADTLISISRRRGSALVLVNPAYTSQIDSRTELLQGKRRGERFYGLDGGVLDADTHAARNILARMYDTETSLYTPFREVKRLPRDRSGPPVGTAPPGLEPAGAATAARTAESESPQTHNF